MTRAVQRIVGGTIVAVIGAAAYVLACGPFLTELRPVLTVTPADRVGYTRGDLGIVRPQFARRYLLQAYRRLNGRPALANVFGPRPSVDSRLPSPSPLDEWLAFRAPILKDADAGVTVRPFTTDRSIGNYQSFPNCLDDAFRAAVATGKARAARFGDGAALRDWTLAQDAVFANCSGKELILPKPAPESSDALTRADRAYQTAAAYFYAVRYVEAADAFRAIGEDASSPWRPYGRYMAARVLIREATIPEKVRPELLERADTELRRVIADPSASVVHESARGLLNFVAVRLHPGERLKTLAASLVGGDTVSDRDLAEYQWVMDKLLGDTTDYSYADVRDRDAIVRSADLNDWVVAMQGGGPLSLERALAQWKRTRSAAWLVATMWKLPAGHPDAPAALDAAAAIDTSSPAYPTLAFLRARFMAEAGNVGQARTLLASLPSAPGAGFDVEAVNLLAAERMKLATSFEELLLNAPRAIAAAVSDGIPEAPSKRVPVFDADAGIVFSERLPLTRLVDASLSSALPDRLRLHVASAAFTRAVLLKRDEDALKLVPALRVLAPSLSADLDRFQQAAPADRHIAAVFLLLRTPGLGTRVTGLEDDVTLAETEPSRKFDHLFRRNWWCGVRQPSYERQATPPQVAFVYPGGDVPSPSFLTSGERAAAEQELAALDRIGNGTIYLATEAVAWAKGRPSDQNAAEALAHAVEGTRWAACFDEKDPKATTRASRAAFQTLHRLFPDSEWAKRTKYWY